MNSPDKNNLITVYNKTYPELSFPELAVLKSQAFGCSETEIFKLLEIDSNEYHLLLQNIYSKFQTNNLFDTIKIALFSNVLNRYDIVKDEVKITALKYSKSLYEALSVLSEDEKNTFPIKQILSEFITEVNKLYFSKATQKERLPLNTQQVDCINDMLENRRLNITNDSQLLKLVEIELANRFNTNNFFNTTRRIFELNLIQKSSVHEEFNCTDSELKIDTSEKIASIFIINKYSEKEKELSIYFDLISYYNKIEDLFLFG